MAYSIIKSQLVELYVNENAATLTNFQFQDQPQLRNALLVGISAYNVSDLAVSPTGHALVSVENFQKSYLTIFGQDMNRPAPPAERESWTPPMGEFINRLPLIELHNVQTGEDTYAKERLFFNNMQIDWSKTYLNMGTAPGAGDFSFLFNIYYQVGPMPLMMVQDY